MTSTWTPADALAVLALALSVAVAAGYWWYRWEMWLGARAPAGLEDNTRTPAALDATGDAHATVIDLTAARRQRVTQAVS
jgi:hypothetical protein